MSLFIEADLMKWNAYIYASNDFDDPNREFRYFLFNIVSTNKQIQL